MPKYKPLHKHHLQLGDERFPLLRRDIDDGVDDDKLYVQVWKDDEPASLWNAHAVPMRIEIVESNHVSDKGGTIRPSATMKIYADDIERSTPKVEVVPGPDGSGDEITTPPWVHIYTKLGRGIEDLMHWWLAHRYRFDEHPMQLWRASDRARIEGHKIWYDGQPAIITRWSPLDSGMQIAPDPRWLRQPYYWAEHEDGWGPFDFTKTERVDFLDDNISWCREIAGKRLP